MEKGMMMKYFTEEVSYTHHSRGIQTVYRSRPYGDDDSISLAMVNLMLRHSDAELTVKIVERDYDEE
jgi:hypothetical protein